MILSNDDIAKAIEERDIVIDPLAPPELEPFNTSSLDLRLAPIIRKPNADPIVHRLDAPYSKEYMARNSETFDLTRQPYTLKPNTFVLGQTLESVAFPMRTGRPAYAARIEGRSSRARLGMLVHFTAPTIHCGFFGPVTLEIINLGPNDIELRPGVFICQLIVEQVSSIPSDAANQFAGQSDPSGGKAA